LAARDQIDDLLQPGPGALTDGLDRLASIFEEWSREKSAQDFADAIP
jgi:hypothetical protein